MSEEDDGRAGKAASRNCPKIVKTVWANPGQSDFSMESTTKTHILTDTTKRAAGKVGNEFKIEIDNVGLFARIPSRPRLGRNKHHMNVMYA